VQDYVLFFFAGVCGLTLLVWYYYN